MKTLFPTALCVLFLLGGMSLEFAASQEAADESPLAYSVDIPCDSGHRTALLIFGEEPEDYDSREKTIASLLTVLRKAGYAEEKILVLTNGNDNTDRQANRKNILTAMKALQNVKEKPPGGQDRELFVYASLKTVAPEDTPYLVCPSNANTLDDLLFEESENFRYKPERLIDLATEFIEPINSSPVERKLLILNTISPPPQTRGGVTVRERGSSREKIAAVTQRTGQTFGQIVVTDSLQLGPGTVNSFVEILEKGIEGYADSTDTGNHDGKVEMNELLAYIERFGNMTSQDAVRTLFKGHDFAMTSYQPEKSVLEMRKNEREAYLEEVKRFSSTMRTPAPQGNRPASAKGKWYCLLFAVGDYENPDVGLSSLDGPHHDMLLIQEKWLFPMRMQMAAERRARPEDVMEIVLLSDWQTNESGETVAKEKSDATFPTRDNFTSQLKRIAEKAGPDDFILVAVACHGYAARGRSVLCPYDIRRFPFRDESNRPMVFAGLSQAAATDRINRHIAENHLIAVKDVIDTLGISRAKKKLFLADACREVVTGDDATREDFMTEFKTLMDSFYNDPKPQTRGLAVMTSCSLDQRAVEEPEGFREAAHANGLFFKSFVEGLNVDLPGCPADMEGNQNGFVSLNEAYNFAFTKTSKEALHQWKTTQTPEIFRGTAWDDFALQWNAGQSRNAGEFTATGDFLIHQAMLRKDAGEYSQSHEILSRLIDMEPNHSQAYVYRSGVQLASLASPSRRPVDSMDVYRSALQDCEKVGRTLDLYVVMPAGGNKASLYRTPSGQTPMRDGNNATVDVFVNQKVSISAVQGDWLYVVRTGDNASQNGLGWIPKNHVTWSEKSVEQYRPATPMNNSAPMERFPSNVRSPMRGSSSGPMSSTTFSGVGK